MTDSALLPPTLQPLGDRALLVRFGSTLSEAANRAAVNFARHIEGRLPVEEVVPNLVSVLLRYDPRRIGLAELAGEVRLLAAVDVEPRAGTGHRVQVRFDGEDLPELAGSLGLSTDDFIAAHNSRPLRMLATGFAPGFVYCGFHPEELVVARRTRIRPTVPAGTVLFAAGQTAIAATPIPTGWHVIGHTNFTNFDASATPPTRLEAGDEIAFEAIS